MKEMEKEQQSLQQKPEKKVPPERVEKPYEPESDREYYPTQIKFEKPKKDDNLDSEQLKQKSYQQDPK